MYQVGYTHVMRIYNSHTNKWENRTHTDWRLTKVHDLPSVHYDKNQPKMQIFGSHKYKREYVQAVAGQEIETVRAMSAQMMTDADGHNREV